MSAIYGTFASIKTMADGTPRITLDLGCTLAEVAALGLMPGAAFGLARITGASTIAPVVEETESVRPGPLCIMACNFCKDPDFWLWLWESDSHHVKSEADAKAILISKLYIKRRIEIDASPIVAAQFLSEIRAPFMAWRADQ